MNINSFRGLITGHHQLHSFFHDDQYFRDTLIEAKIWFADPRGFNDPFDCSLPAAKIGSTDMLLRYLEKQEPTMSAEQRLTRAAMIIADPDSQSLDYMNRIYLLGLGVRCFSKRDDNILMWAHYGENHTGVCLTFDLEKDEQFFSANDLLAVSYEEDFTDFDFIKFGSDVLPEELIEKMMAHFIGIKSIEWSYETEIRLVKSVENTLELAKEYLSRGPHPKALFEAVRQTIEYKNNKRLIDRKVPFVREALVEIKFGCNASRSSIEEIRRIVKDNDYNVKLKQAIPNKEKFGITFQEC